MAENEWTVMFFFAGDNNLSPLIVSQIKAIKDAGFQERTNVLVHFDSNANGAPTRIYEVNRERKKDPRLPKTIIGDGKDPFVRNMRDDYLRPDKIDTNVGDASADVSRALQNPGTVTATDALRNFIGFCRENYKAKHYLLFLVGHGLIVGNDTFLPDDSPESAITLRDFDDILRCFTKDVNKDGGAFDMLALHSCSMSAIEVAYQLRGTAKYMMASEGVSYVGSWPYRQLLKKLFNTIEETKQEARESASYIPTLMSKLYYLTLFNATDYMLSGYSLDLSLCNLAEEKFDKLKEPFQNLVAVLRQALSDEDKRVKELIQLAHLESQSYWQEEYTDLFDFCLCLGRNCDEKNDRQESIKDACIAMMGYLQPDDADPFSRLIVHSENFGSQYQYSHGLSIYFPWSEPTDDDPVPITGAPRAAMPTQPQEKLLSRAMVNYQQYAFASDFEENSWFNFLNTYFDKTQRQFRTDEDGGGGFTHLKFNLVPVVFDSFGPLSGNPTLTDGPGGGKSGGATGAVCSCPSIKNYKTVVADIDNKPQTVKAVTISKGLIDAFK